MREAGAREVEVCGNLKFDMTPTLRWWRAVVPGGDALARPVVLMASSREGEEPPLLAAWRAQREPRPLLLLVPRHPQRFDEVAQLARDAGFTLARRSSWGDEPTASEAAGRCVARRFDGRDAAVLRRRRCGACSAAALRRWAGRT